MDFIELFKRQLAASKDKVSKLSLKNYISDLRHFSNWLEMTTGNKFDPRNITADTLKLYSQSLGAIIIDGAMEKEKLSQSSMKRHLSSLRKFMETMRREGIIEENPFEREKQNESSQDDYDYWHFDSFKDYLFSVKASKLTVKNYIADIKGFARWYEEAILPGIEKPLTSTDGFYRISQDIVEEYKNRLIQVQSSAPRTINRKLSSLRRYLEFATKKGFIIHEEIVIPSVGLENKAESPVSIQLSELNKLKVDEKKAYSGFAPLRLLQKLVIFPYLTAEEAIASKAATILSGKEIVAGIALSQVDKLRIQSKAIVNAQNRTIDAILGVRNVKKEFYAPHQVQLSGLPFHKKLVHHIKYTRPKWYRTYHSYPFVHYAHFALLIIFAVGVGVAAYQNLVGSNQKPTFASPTAPPRILSFQGRLTDANDNPITSATDIRFAIYNDITASGAALLWQEVHYVVYPDQDGIFSVLLGTNTTIPSTVFSDNAGTYLGVTINQTSELTPRQRIASVAYATNSEQLQGMQPITAIGAGTSNVVLALDSSGNLTIGGSANPTFSASGGQFHLSGETLLLATNASSNGNIVLSPDGLGKIDLQKPLVNTTATGNLTPGGVEVNDKFGVLATESAVAAFTVNNDGSSDIFTASSGGTTRFTIGTTGVLTIPVYNTNGGIFYANGSGSVAQTSAGSLGQCLQSIGGGTPTWGACGSSASNWRINSGAISPVNDTLDVLFGNSATTSAKFGFLNVGSGTPVASISANSANNWTTLSGDGILGTTNKQTLSIGNASTGNIVINSPTDSKTSIGTTSSLGTLKIAGNSPGKALVNLQYLGSGQNILVASNSAGTNVFTIEEDGDIIVGNGGNGKLTAAIIDPYLIQNQYTSVTPELIFQTMAASNGDFIYKNQSTEIARLAQAGQFQLPITGSSGGLVIGGDTQLFRGAADRLDLASGDSFNVVSGNIQIGGATVIDSSSNGTFANLTVTGSCSGCISAGNSPFKELAGAIVPNNSTLDFLLGGQATASAKFGVLNIGTGTPTASISANSGNISTYITGDGTLATTNRQSLTIGNSSTYNTTGNVWINPNGTGNVGIGTTIAPAKLNSLATTEQLRLLYDSTNYSSFTVNSSGDLTVAPSGGDSNITGTLDVSGHGAFGSSASISTANILNLSEIFSDVASARFLNNTNTLSTSADYSSTAFGINNNFTVSGTGNQVTGRVAGIENILTFNSSGTSANLLGIENVTGLGASSGNATQVAGNYNRIDNNSSNTITTANTIWGANPLGSGAITTLRGLYIAGLTRGSTSNIGVQIDTPSGATNNYALYLSGAGGTAASGIQFASDTNLYRSAANTLRTDDTLDVGSSATISGNLTLAGVVRSIQTTANNTLTLGGDTTGNIVLSPLNGSGVLQFTNFSTNGGIIYTNASGVLAQTGAGSSNQCLLGGTTPTFGSCASGTSISPFQELAGAIVPNNSTLDFLIGAQATGSAKFAFLNANSGTPVASISANSGNIATYITGDGSLATTNRQTLTIGNSSTYNTTGNVLINSNATGNIGLRTATPTSFNVEFAGSLGPAVDNSSVLGSASRRLNSIYLGDGGLQAVGNAATTGSININTASSAVTVTRYGQRILNNTLNTTTDGIDKYGLYINNTGSFTGLTGTSTNNYSLYISTPSGADNNYSIYSAGGTNYLAGNTGLGTTTPTALLDVAGTASVSGALKLYGTPTIQSTANQTLTLGGDTTGNIVLSPLNGSGTIQITNFITNGGLLYTNASGVLAQTGAGTSAQCLLGGATPTFGSCSTGTSISPFQELSGAIVPNNSTVDLLVGGQSTASAKFAFLNNNSGTPVASISANSGNIATYITGDGSLSTTNRQSLTIGNSSAYDTTGNVLINPNGTGNVGIGTTSPRTKLHVSGGNILLDNNRTLQFINSAGTLLSGVTLSGSNFWSFGSNNSSTAGTNILAGSGATANIDFILGSALTAVRIAAITGNVGIGTTSPNAILHVNGGTTGGNSALIVNQTGASGNNILSASSSGITKLVLTNGGALQLVGGQTSDIDTLTATTLNIGATNTTTISLGRSGQGITLPGFTGQNGVLYGTSGTGVLAQATTGSSNQCLLSGASNPSWGTCPGAGSSGSNWTINSGDGTIYPINSTLDVLLGGTASSSAKFAFLNIAGLTPTASISANSGDNNTFLTGLGNLGTTNAQTLTLGGSTTGNVIIDSGSSAISLLDNTNITGDLSLSGTTGITLSGSNADITFTGSSNHDITASSGVLRLGALTLTGTITGGNQTINNIGNISANSSSNTLTSFGTIGSASVTNFNGTTLTLTGSSTDITSGTNEDLTIAANGSGNLILTSDFNTGVKIGTSSNIIAPLSVSGGIGSNAGFILDQLNSGDLFVASASGVNKFAITNGGSLQLTGGQTIDTISSGTLGIGTINATTITLGRSGQGITLPGFTGQNGVLYGTSGTGVLAQATTGSSNQCLLSGASNPSWGTCPGAGSSGSNWTINSGDGTIYPINSTLDVLLGGTASSSAKFAILNIAGTATPVASVSAIGGANDGKGIAISGNGSIQSLRNNDLTLGGNTTGNIIISASDDNGKIGLGISSPISQLHLSRSLASGTTGKALAIFDQIESQDIFAASSSGITRFVIGNDGRVGINTALSPTGVNPLAMLQVFSSLGTSPAASISANTAAPALLVTNEGVGDLFAASRAGVTLFRVQNNGNLIVGDGGGAGSKITVENQDPLYNIDGKKYSTSAPSMLGFKEEITGRIIPAYDPQAGAYSYTFDFNNAIRESDFWVFTRVIKPDIKDVSILMTPNSPARTWYKKDGTKRTITMYSDRPVEISYRMTAPQINADKYPTIALPKDYGIKGVDTPPPPNPVGTSEGDNNIAVDPYFATLTINESNGEWVLKDSYNNKVNHIDAFSKVIAANIQSGFINAKKITTDTISAGSASLTSLTTSTLSLTSDNVTIAGQNLREFILATVQNAGFTQNGSQIISPIASIDQIKTNIISPLAEEGSVALHINPNDLEIKNTNTDDVVARIDDEGNATFSGTLQSEVALFDSASISGNLATNNLETNNASVAGTLRADKIIANDIEGIDNRISSIANNLINNASSSGGFNQSENLAIGSLNAQFGLFEQGIVSLGSGTFSQLTAIDSIAIGQGFILGNNSINTLGADLEIQPLRQGNISFMAGRITIDTDGNMAIDGNIQIAGNLTAARGIFSDTLESKSLVTNIISPLANNDLILRVFGDNFASNSGKLQIQNSQGNQVIGINGKGDIVSSGSARFAKLNLSLAGQAEAINENEAVATGSAGFATLRSGRPEITIINPNITSESLVYITPFGNTNNKVLYLLRQTPSDPENGIVGSFTVGASGNSSAQDLQFNWLIVN